MIFSRIISKTIFKFYETYIIYTISYDKSYMKVAFQNFNSAYIVKSNIFYILQNYIL